MYMHDIDKSIPVCLNLDFSNSFNIETANIYNVSKCNVTLSGSKLQALSIEYLMLCHVHVLCGIALENKESHTQTKESISINNNINSIDIMHCKVSEFAFYYQSFESGHQNVNVSNLNCKRSKECKLDFDKNVEIKNVFLAEIDTFPKFTQETVSQLYIKQELSDSNVSALGNAINDLTKFRNLTSLKVEGYAKNLGIELEMVMQSACHIESLGMSFYDFTHYCQTNALKITGIKYLTLFGISKKTMNSKDSNNEQKNELVSTQPLNFGNLRRLTCKGLTEEDFVSLGNWFSSLPFLQK